jgi:cytochrome c-type biogenesis protein CcmF
MDSVGTIALQLAIVACGLGAAIALEARRRRDAMWLDVAVRAVHVASTLVILALGALLFSILLDDFQLKMVQKSSSRDLSLAFKLSLMWISLDSSMLFWAAVQAACASLAVASLRKRAPHLLPVASAVLMLVLGFFIYLLLMRHNPFDSYVLERPIHGAGMKPLLRNFWMLIHPPAQYLGYVATSVPFAYLAAALVEGPGRSVWLKPGWDTAEPEEKPKTDRGFGCLDKSWIQVTRPWLLVSWLFCGLGLVLGMIWAYEEVDWGGYWNWDAVENASLMPFLTATAALHSLAAFSSRRRLAGWTALMVLLTFWLTIVGTFFTRTGVIQSIHSFGKDSVLAWAFMIFIGAGTLPSFGGLLYRLNVLGPERSAGDTSWLSRLSAKPMAFVLCNWFLLLSTLFVLTASVAPAFSELFTGNKLELKPSFYESWITPLSLLALAVLGLGQVLPWRGFSSGQQGLKKVWLPLAAFLVGILWAKLGPLSGTGTLAMLAVGLAFMTAAGALQEGIPLVGRGSAGLRALGYTLVHLGIAMAFVGFAGKGAQKAKQVVLKPGETVALADMKFKFLGVITRPTLESDVLRAEINVDREGRPAGIMRPGMEVFIDFPRMPMSMTALDRGLMNDVQIRLRSTFRDGSAKFQIIAHPLASFIWLGFLVLTIGGLLLPMVARGKRKTGPEPSARPAALTPRIWAAALGGWAVAAYIYFSLGGRFSPFGATAAILAAAAAALPATALAAFELAYAAATNFADRPRREGT